MFACVDVYVYDCLCLYGMCAEKRMEKHVIATSNSVFSALVTMQVFAPNSPCTKDVNWLSTMVKWRILPHCGYIDLPIAGWINPAIDGQ